MSEYTKQYDAKVRVAIEEAQRFIDRANTYLAETCAYSNAKPRAAMKRASMDLSRSLVPIRGAIHT